MTWVLRKRHRIPLVLVLTFVLVFLGLLASKQQRILLQSARLYYITPRNTEIVAKSHDLRSFEAGRKDESYLSSAEMSYDSQSDSVTYGETSEEHVQDFESELEGPGYERFKMRRERIREFCESHHPEEPVNRTVKEGFLYFYKQNAALCTIAKAGSSTWRTHLRKVNNGPPNNKPIFDDPRLKEKQKGTVEDILRDLKSASRIITVRHPLSRLVSCFRSKFNRGLRMKPFDWKKENKRSKKHAIESWFGQMREYWLPALNANKRIPPDLHMKLNLSKPIDPDLRYTNQVYLKIYKFLRPKINFTQFINFVVTSHLEGKPNSHWKTYTKKCSPCHLDYQYVTTIETMNEDLKLVFKRLGIPSKETLEENSSRRSDSLYKDFRMFTWIPKELRDQVKQIYWEDMQLFGYPWPEILK